MVQLIESDFKLWAASVLAAPHQLVRKLSGVHGLPREFVSMRIEQCGTTSSYFVHGTWTHQTWIGAAAALTITSNKSAVSMVGIANLHEREIVDFSSHDPSSIAPCEHIGSGILDISCGQGLTGTHCSGSVSTIAFL
jgi:hypothetical protein